MHEAQFRYGDAVSKDQVTLSFGPAGRALVKALSEHLTDCMAETALQIGVTSPAVEVLRQALAEDLELHHEAMELTESSAPAEQRCHMTRWRNGLLRQALGPMDVRDVPG